MIGDSFSSSALILKLYQLALAAPSGLTWDPSIDKITMAPLAFSFHGTPLLRNFLFTLLRFVLLAVSRGKCVDFGLKTLSL